jgi:hypothetical protein
MRSILKLVLPSTVGLCFAFWLVTVQIARNTATPFWAYWWLSVVAIGAALLAGAWVALMLDDSAPRRGLGPDFRLTRRGPRLVELTRLSRREAFAVRQGDGQVAMSLYIEGLAGVLLGDMERSHSMSLGLPNDTGCWVWFSWIERGGRYYTKSVYIDDQTTSLDLRGILLERGETLQS